jgi:hypothetical protein
LEALEGARKRRAHVLCPAHVLHHPRAPCTCGRFKLCGKLGSGAFADVYRVRFVDPASSPKDAALKVLRPTGSHPVSAAAAAAAIEAGEGLPVSPVADSVTPSVMLFREARALKHAQGP